MVKKAISYANRGCFVTFLQFRPKTSKTDKNDGEVCKKVVKPSLIRSVLQAHLAGFGGPFHASIQVLRRSL